MRTLLAFALRSPTARCKQAGVCAARGPERWGFDGDAGRSGIDRAQLSRNSPWKLPLEKQSQALALKGSWGAVCALDEPRCATFRIHLQPDTRQRSLRPAGLATSTLSHLMQLSDQLKAPRTEEDRCCGV